MILYINSNNNEVTYNKRDYLLRAAERMGWQDKVLRHDPAVVPDYVINIEPYGHLVTGKKWTGLWEIDVMLDRPEMNLDKWTHCDTVFIANNSLPDHMNAFQGHRVTMFQACDPELHKRVNNKPMYDFVFSGSTGTYIYDKRAHAIQTLRDEGFSFYDYGKGHTPQKYVEFISNARVQFCYSGAKPPIAESQVEQRFFECLAIGPVLKDYAPDLEQLALVEGEDFFWFKTPEEMKQKMHYLIDNPDFAKKMADSGRRKALLYHTYEHRLVSIFNNIHEHIPRTT